METDDVRSGQESSELGHVPGQPGVGPGGVDDLHVEAGGPLRHGAGDAPVPDQAQGRTVYVMGKVIGEAPPVPTAVAQVVLGRAGVSGGRQDQQEGEVGRGGIEDAGGVAHCDAPCVGAGHVDVVVPHGGVGHDAQPARPTVVVVVGRDDLVAGLRQRIGAAGRQATGDEDPGHAQWLV